MKEWKRILVGLLALLLVFGGVTTPLVSVEAATKVTKAQIKDAKSAYAKQLKENKTIEKFRVMDVMGNSIPELLTIENGCVGVYTYNVKDKVTVMQMRREADNVYYHPTKKRIVCVKEDKYSDFDEHFFIEAFIYNNGDIWETLDSIKEPADITATTIIMCDGNPSNFLYLIGYEGKVRQSGETFSGYEDPWRGSMSKASFEKKYKSLMTGAKKITKFDKNSATNRKKLK